MNAVNPFAPLSLYRDFSELSPTARKVVMAYGGPERWLSAKSISASVTVSGLLFRLWKRRITPPGMLLTIDPHRPFAMLAPINKYGDTGTFDGLDVRTHAPNGVLLGENRDTRGLFPAKGGRRLKWSELDITYFLGYAFWGYFTLPLLLMRRDVEWTEVEEGVLEAVFPDHLPAHSSTQRYWFDTTTWLLVRNDYHPGVVTSDQKAWVANVVTEHGGSNGVPYTSRRAVTPTKGRYGQPLPFPRVVGIAVDDWIMA